MIFNKRGLEYLRVAKEYNLYKRLGDINICGVFDIFKVKVSVIFSGTGVFPPRRDGCYITLVLIRMINYISPIVFKWAYEYVWVVVLVWP